MLRHLWASSNIDTDCPIHGFEYGRATNADNRYHIQRSAPFQETTLLSLLQQLLQENDNLAFQYAS